MTHRSSAVAVSCVLFATSLQAASLGIAMDRIHESLDSRESPSAAERYEAASRVAAYTQDLEPNKIYGDWMEWTARKVREWLRSEREPWIRAALVEALADTDRKGEAGWIAEYVSDEDPTLRARAAEFLPVPFSERVERALVEQCASETLWWVKAVFVERLGSGKTEASLAALHRALNDPSPDVRAAATHALVRRRDRRSVGPLIDALERGDLIGMDSPVWALGSIGDRRALEALHRVSTAPFPLVRKGVAWALGEIRDPSSRSALARLARHDPDAGVRAESIDALARLGGAGAALELLTLLEHERNERTFHALIGIPEADVVAACKQFVDREAMDRAKVEARRKLCERAKEQIDTDAWFDLWFYDTGEMHSMFDSAANANARRIAPARGWNAVAWQNAVSEDLGGTRQEIERGTRVTVRRGAWYQGDTWLEVSAGPSGDRLWIRESDTQRIDPKTLRKEPVWTDYGTFGETQGQVATGG